MVGNTAHHIQNSQDFAKKVYHLKLQPEETIGSYNVISLFKCIPRPEARETIHKSLLLDNHLWEKNSLIKDPNLHYAGPLLKHHLLPI